MLEKLADWSGLYFPSFFGIKLNTTKPLNSFLSEDSGGVFLHEYVHFLQDISTTYGVVNFCKTLEAIKALYSEFKDKEEIEIPFIWEPSSIQSINNVLFDKYFQSISYEEAGCQIISIHHDIDNEIPGRPIKTFSAKLCSGKNVKLGSFTILEGMAKLIQEINYPSKRVSQYLPYDLVPEIAKFYLGKNALSKSQLVIICDISLFYLNSMEQFIKLLEDIKRNSSLIELSDEGLHNYFINQNLIGLDGRKKLLLEEYEFCVDQAISAIEGVFGSLLYVEMKEWLLSFLNTAKGLRQFSYPLFIFLSSSKTGRKTYSKLLIKFGFPPTQNIVGEVFVHKDAFPVLASHHFMAILAVFDVIYNKTRSCQLQDCCKAGGKWDVSEECQTHPWNKKLLNNELCPFCAIWKTFGLEGKLVIDNSPFI